MMNATPRQPERINLTEQVYRELKRRIFNYQLLPGERFSESALAELLSASRTPVREALSRLQSEGFVEVFFRSGWQVKPFDFNQYEQLYDVRIALELAAVKALDQAAVAERLADQIAIWMVAPDQRLCDAETVCTLDERFHQRLVEATGNLEMARIHHDVTERLRIVRHLDFSQQPRIAITYEEHARILRLLLAGETEHAVACLQQHIEDSKAEVHKITLQMITQALQTQFNSRRHINADS